MSLFGVWYLPNKSPYRKEDGMHRTLALIYWSENAKKPSVILRHDFLSEVTDGLEFYAKGTETFLKIPQEGSKRAVCFMSHGHQLKVRTETLLVSVEMHASDEDDATQFAEAFRADGWEFLDTEKYEHFLKLFREDID